MLIGERIDKLEKRVYLFKSTQLVIAMPLLICPFDNLCVHLLLEIFISVFFALQVVVIEVVVIVTVTVVNVGVMAVLVEACI